MKPNINDLSKFADVKAALEAKGVSRATIETLDKVLNRGLVVERPADLSFLSIPAAELTLVSSSVTFGASQPEPQDFRTLQFKFLPIHLPGIDPVTGLPGPVNPNVANSFFGNQFVIGYANKQNYTVEEAYPIADSRSVIVDLDLNQILDHSEVVYQVKDPQGEFARIDFVSTAGDPSSGSLTVNKNDLENAEIKVGVVTTAIKIDAKTGSYQVKGKVLSDDTDEKMEDYQILIAASVIDPAIGSHEYLPVAYARTETGGYFVTSFLQFADAEDIDRVTDAKAIVAKDDFRAEFPVKLVKGKKKALNSDNVEVEVVTSRIPHRLILMIDLESQEGDAADEICGCSELNFHEKKVFEEFSYQTVVRTTEPAIIANVIEEEDEIDLGEIYGEGLSGVRVPRGVFRQFHSIKSRQPMIRAAAAAVPDLHATSSTILMRAGTATGPTLDATSPLTSRRPFTEFDARLLDGLMVDYRADKAVQPPNKPRVNKGRAHLTPLNQINWDKATIYQAASIAHGHLLHFKQEWIPDGYSIGDLLYSLPLAPGQKKQIAVLDWERRESAANSQTLDYEESLNNTLIRDRDVSEVVTATLNENMTGSSTARTGGFGFGLGSAVMGVFQGGTYGGLMGISGGKSKASSTASQTSHRDSTANSLQSIRDRTTQAANAVRSQRSTVIQTVSQGERVQATSESVANYNHCHAITIQYFEVVRHFAVHNRFVDAQECLFIPLQITNFDLEKVLRWRSSLERCLFNPALRAGFDALERIQNEKESTTEDYYKSIGYPEKYFAEQQIVSFQGELYMEFYFFNPKNPVDDALIEFFQKFFRIDLKEYHDRTLSNDELARLVGPRTIEFLLDALVIETETGQSLNVDVTLVTPFRQNARLQVSLRQSGLVSIARDRINGIRIRIDEAKVRAQDATDIKLFLDKYMKILIRSGSIRYRTLNFSGTLFNTRIDNDLFVGLDSVFIPTPLNSEELRNPRGEDIDAANNLIHHLNENLEHYHKCLWFHMSDERRFMLLDGIVAPGKANGRSVASVVENRIIGVAGNSLIMPVAPGFQLDPTINSKDPVDLKGMYYEEDSEPMRISLPTKGVYAESVIGKCNACEEKDESRFWRWEESPIPDSPNTQINPIDMSTRRTDPGDLRPKDFPAPVVNIQNAPNIPDPAGLQAMLQLIGKGDSFRDITGLSENQKNALAVFQKSLDSAQAFGKEASDLAKTAGMLEAIKNAKNDGTLSNEMAKKMSEKVIDRGTESKDSDLERLNKGMELLKKLEKDGTITTETAIQAKGNLLKTFLDDDISKTIDRVNQSKAGEVSVKKPDGTAVSTKFSDASGTPPAVGNRVGRGGVTPLRQENSMACWATVATMMVRWKDSRAYTIEEVLAKAGQRYVDFYRDKKGLPYSDKTDFISRLGMTGEPPASYAAFAYRDMLLAFGPLWVTIDADDSAGFSAHALVVTGISNDLATLEVIDPATGTQRQISFDDFSNQFSSIVIDGPSMPATQVVRFTTPVVAAGGDAEEGAAPSMAQLVNEYDPGDETAIVINMAEFATGIAGIRNYKGWATDASLPHNRRRNGYRSAANVIQIVVHETAADTGDGFDDSANTTSHLSVKRDATILQFNDLLEFENHSSGLNSTSIGIEFVNRGWLSSKTANGGEGIPATETALTAAQKDTFKEANGYLWAFWGNGFNIYRTPPSLTQLEKEVELLTWLTDTLDATIASAPAEFQNQFPVLAKRWLQLVSYDEVEPVWTFKDINIPPDADKSKKKFFVMTTGYDYLTPTHVRTKGGIISHNATYENHSDGSFQALYTWLRMEKGKDDNKSFELCKTLMKQHWFRVTPKSDSDKRIVLLDVDDTNLV